MSQTKFTGSRKPGPRKPSPNYLSADQTKTINNYVGKIFGLTGLQGCDVQHLTHAERHLQKAFWSKYSSPGLSVMTGKADVGPSDRKSRAISKWLATEQRNKKTNNRLIFQSCDFGFSTSSDILKLARKYILQTIGKAPPRVILGSFTGGASTRISRSPGNIAAKFEGKAHVSSSAKPYWTSLIFETTGWFTQNPEVWVTETREDSVLFTVPKNSEIDRVACKEPEINMYLQRGCGDFIRKRLKRHGIDLNDQSHNRNLAREASVTRRHVTIDLSSASDTVSTSLVRLLLPFEWFDTLNDLRVKGVELPDGNRHDLEMFSSMGNGFTFELESLIFWALTRATSASIRCRGKILVYGDDIVAPKPTGLALLRVLAWFGFTVNSVKSCLSGPYRESCGGHYHDGSDVTPVYFRQKITTMSEVIQLGNQLIRWVKETPLGVSSSVGVLDMISFIMSFVPAGLHGGQSLERTDALVTGCAPRQRLVQVSKRVEIPQVGGCLWWHHEKDRTPEQVFSPSESALLGRWVLRPNRSWYEGELMGFIAHELWSCSDRYEIAVALSA